METLGAFSSSPSVSLHTYSLIVVSYPQKAQSTPPNFAPLKLDFRFEGLAQPTLQELVPNLQSPRGTPKAYMGRSLNSGTFGILFYKGAVL